MSKATSSVGRMPRTPLLRSLIKAVRQAHFFARHPELGSLRDELPELGAAARAGDRIARRQFLGQAALFAASLPLAGALLERPAYAATAAPPLLPRRRSRNVDPVAILGAGAAGLTAAYRLTQAGIPCEVFEAGPRIGGRILTLKGYFNDGQFCELGGELVDSNHEDLMALAKELGIGIQELKEGDSGVELYHIDGKLHTEKELIPLFAGLGKAIADEQEKLYVTDKDGVKDWTDHAKELDQKSIKEWLAAHASGTEKWVLDLLNVAYTIEYGRDTGVQSALNFLAYIDPDTTKGFEMFGESDESKRIAGGNSEIIFALEKALAGKVKINLGQKLVRLEDRKATIDLTLQTGPKSATRSFSRIICTLPFTMVREIEGIDQLGLSPEKLAAIKNLGYGTSVKVMYGFTSRLWREAKGGRPECNGSIYTSTSSQCFWETSRKQDGKSGLLTNFMGADQGERAIDDARKKETLDNLDKVVPGMTQAHDGKWRSFVWPTYPFTKGAYSCPLVGQLTTLAPAAATTELDGRIYFAGEHTSDDFSGFMNGAVESGNRVAKEIAAKK